MITEDGSNYVGDFEPWINTRDPNEVECGVCHGRGVDKRGDECLNCYGDGTVILVGI